MKTKSSPLEPVTYIPARTRLGDTVIAVNNAIVVAKRLRKPVRMMFHPKIFGFDRKEHARCLQRMDAALHLFDHAGRIHVVDHVSGTTHMLEKLPESCYLDNARKDVQCLQARDVICYDLNPNLVNVGKADRERLREFLEGVAAETMDCHKVGIERGLIPMIERMRHCRCFVGADSGMAHVAHAIGLEAHLIAFNGAVDRLKRWHQFNQYVLYHTTDEFIREFR